MQKPCSGCGFAFMIVSNSAIVAGPIGLAQHGCRRPFRVTPMARWHVLRDRRVLVHGARVYVAPYPLSLVEDLDGAIREARFHGLAQQPERHRVVIDLDMIVRRNRAALPLGILVALARKPFQRRPVGANSLRSSAASASSSGTGQVMPIKAARRIYSPIAVRPTIADRLLDIFA